MESGIYYGLAFEEYLKVKAISKSALIQLRKTPRHLREYLDGAGGDETDSMKLGTAAHVRVLEPERFSSTYAVGPVDDRRTKEWKEFEQSCPDGMTPIQPGMVADAASIAKQVDSKPLIRQLIRMSGPVEVSLFWEDPLFGFQSKGRADKLIPSLGLVVDLKTARDLSDRGLQKAIHERGYHLQAQHYLDGMRALGQPCDRFVIVWAENSAPFEVRATEFSRGCEWLELARVEMQALRTKYAECLESNEWPGYADGVEEAPLPPAWLQGLNLSAA